MIPGGVRGPLRGLAGVRVLDFTKLLPGPYAGAVLAQLGMKVVKVELPHFPDGARGTPLFPLLNSRKRELSLDFRKPAGLKKALALVKGADVLLEGFRPGLMDRVGLGWGALRKLNPRLVYCSLVGYPPEGPWARKAGHDLNFLSVSGMLGLSPAPALLPAQVADLSGAMAAVSSILAALLARQKTKKGARVVAAMSESAHAWLPIPLAERAAEGRDPAPPRWWDGSHPFYRLYAAADGKLIAVGALEKGFALSLLDAMGLSELKPLCDDALGNAGALAAALSSAFASRPREHWLESFEGKDLCVTPVLGLGEAVSFQSTLSGKQG